VRVFETDRPIEEGEATVDERLGFAAEITASAPSVLHQSYYQADRDAPKMISIPERRDIPIANPLVSLQGSKPGRGPAAEEK
jgi:hypothetical protein